MKAKLSKSQWQLIGKQAGWIKTSKITQTKQSQITERLEELDFYFDGNESFQIDISNLSNNPTFFYRVTGTLDFKYQPYEKPESPGMGGNYPGSRESFDITNIIINEINLTLDNGIKKQITPDLYQDLYNKVSNKAIDIVESHRESIQTKKLEKLEK